MDFHTSWFSSSLPCSSFSLCFMGFSEGPISHLLLFLKVLLFFSTYIFLPATCIQMPSIIQWPSFEHQARKCNCLNVIPTWVLVSKTLRFSVSQAELIISHQIPHLPVFPASVSHRPPGGSNQKTKSHLSFLYLINILWDIHNVPSSVTGSRRVYNLWGDRQGR